MELKLFPDVTFPLLITLLIVPYGIETEPPPSIMMLSLLLIVPYGIETG